MNIIQDINKFSSNEILLCEPIKNTVIENSNFIRILITNKDIIINGIYLNLVLENKIVLDKNINSIATNYKYKKFFFITSNNLNKQIIEKLKIIEKQILHKINITNKNKVFKLSNNLDNGIIKVFFENLNANNYNNTFKEIMENKHFLILKISGIWENETCYGITYKFMLKFNEHSK